MSWRHHAECRYAECRYAERRSTHFWPFEKTEECESTKKWRATGTNMRVLTVLKEKPDKQARKLTLKMVFI